MSAYEISGYCAWAIGTDLFHAIADAEADGRIPVRPKVEPLNSIAKTFEEAVRIAMQAVSGADTMKGGITAMLQTHLVISIPSKRVEDTHVWVICGLEAEKQLTHLSTRV